MPARLMGALVTAMILAVTLPIAARMERVQRQGFCRPAATLASAMLGVNSTPRADGSGYAIPVTPMPIFVALECSAIRYFCVASALLVGLCVERRRCGLALVMILAAYALTLSANAARIVSGWQAQRLAMRHLCAKDLASLHMMVGALCFSVFLVSAYMFIERILSDERPPVAA